MPVRGRKYHQKNRGISLCKSHIYKDLSWLHGYPLSCTDDHVRWVAISIKPIYPSRMVELTTADLDQSLKTWSYLTREFPLALPLVIENLGRWHSHLPKLITQLKEAIAGQAELPTHLFGEIGIYNPDVSHKASQLAQQWAEEKLILDAFSWLNYLRPQHAMSALNWLENQHPLDLNQRSLISIGEDWERYLAKEE